MKRKSVEQFINESRIVHGDKYDYSLVKYKSNKDKVKIICPEHGVFEQSPQDHLKNHGCPLCSNNKNYTTSEFINKLKKIYENKYDYSLVDYKNNKIKVKIICPEHGTFSIRPDLFLQERMRCPKCNDKINSKSKFIEKSKEVHNNRYDYSLVEYKNTSIKVKIICPEHGIFKQTPHNHLSGNKCPRCSNNQKLTNNQFIEKSNGIHNDKYDYSLIRYKNTDTKVKIICPEHGVFEQKPSIHLSGCGCPFCKESKGEKRIKDILQKLDVCFIQQYKNKECKNKNCLPFDFFIPDENLAIEYDGIQHFKERDFFGGKKYFEYTIKNDKIKNKYCKENDIDILRIPYYEYNNIEYILYEKINN